MTPNYSLEHIQKHEQHAFNMQTRVKQARGNRELPKDAIKSRCQTQSQINKKEDKQLIKHNDDIRIIIFS